MEILEAIPDYHEDRDMEEPQDLVETILDKHSHKRKLAWAWELLREAERHATPEGIHRERERGKIHKIYMWLCCVKSLTETLPPKKRLQKLKNGRML